ncbi:diheme cytochrome c [Leptolyngbya sp. CCY15150]|uniref:diheme cytochrome c n=1 Tax=Leptolyngbya sp. CCY15150 TaxID=2767772 RepID=UPI001EF2B7EB|nr:diheme cytochrome c [Leptolyngbya sp. CCY15150]
MARFDFASPSRGRSPRLIVVMLVGLLSVLLSLGLTQTRPALASSPQAIAQSDTQTAPLALPERPSIGTVDPVPEDYHLGQRRYLETCAGCHLPLPPAVMPDETWRQLLQDPQHYGVILPQQLPTQTVQIWDYLRDFSRPLRDGETVPYRLNTSRYFAALHPQVEFSAPITANSCTACHIGAEDYNYRQLTAEWQ